MSDGKKINQVSATAPQSGDQWPLNRGGVDATTTATLFEEWLRQNGHLTGDAITGYIDGASGARWQFDQVPLDATNIFAGNLTLNAQNKQTFRVVTAGTHTLQGFSNAPATAVLKLTIYLTFGSTSHNFNFASGFAELPGSKPFNKAANQLNIIEIWRFGSTFVYRVENSLSVGSPVVVTHTIPSADVLTSNSSPFNVPNTAPPSGFYRMRIAMYGYFKGGGDYATNTTTRVQSTTGVGEFLEIDNNTSEEDVYTMKANQIYAAASGVLGEGLQVFTPSGNPEDGTADLIIVETFCDFPIP
jgi:hypothetical protein